MNNIVDSLRRCSDNDGGCESCAYFNELENCKCYMHLCRDAADEIQSLRDISGWKSVGESLPRIKQLCVVLHRNGVIDTARRGKAGWISTEGDLTPITHWISIPDIPETVKIYNNAMKV